MSEKRKGKKKAQTKEKKIEGEKKVGGILYNEKRAKQRIHCHRDHPLRKGLKKNQ